MWAVESAQDNTVAVVAIAVSGGVALLVAIIAALTAQRRQDAALDHDRRMRVRDQEAAQRRQEAALEHDRRMRVRDQEAALQREEAALAHDRKMRIREESIEALDAALTASFAWVGRLVRLESYWKERRDLDDPEVKALAVETNASIQAMYAAGARLDLRFGENSAISQAFEQMLNTARSLAQALQPYAARASFVDHAETVSETERQANDALKKFVEEAKSWRDVA